MNRTTPKQHQTDSSDVQIQTQAGHRDREGGRGKSSIDTDPESK